MADTAERSLDHWSEAGRRGMEDFYALATDDYRHLAEAADWRGWFEARQAAAGGRALRLLDVACGSGKFPTALVAHAGLGEARIEPVDYDLLDPSAFSLAEAARALRPPFVAGRRFETPLESFEAPATPYDVVWATHALYAVPEAALPAALERFLAATGGQGFIAHALAEAHYIRFYRLFLDAFRDGRGEPYRTAEEIVDGLRRLGATVELREIAYDSAAPREAEATVEGFLRRCAFDDAVSLRAMLDHPLTGEYLAACRHDSAWRFPQRVGLITVTP